MSLATCRVRFSLAHVLLGDPLPCLGQSEDLWCHEGLEDSGKMCWCYPAAYGALLPPLPVLWDAGGVLSSRGGSPFPAWGSQLWWELWYGTSPAAPLLALGLYPLAGGTRVSVGGHGAVV